MKRLVQLIEDLRGKLDGIRKFGLKETQTRTIFINPILQALGWDIHDPREVVEEFPTVDGKSVDYALKINEKPVLLVEAKSLDDPLDDVKGITQIVGYAAIAGIDWCILTNGARWKAYSTREKCPAPEKLLFEVSIDPDDSPDVPVEGITEKMWWFSREGMANMKLDAIGEKTFTDSRIRKALDALMADAPRPFLNLVRTAAGDESLAPRKIKESLARLGAVWSAGLPSATQRAGTAQMPDTAKRGDGSRPGRESSDREVYDEGYHLAGMSKEIVELYRAIDSACFSQSSNEVSKVYRKLYVAWKKGKRVFCCVVIQRGGLRVFLNLKYSRIQEPPPFARDVSNTGHWCPGDLELAVSDLSQIEGAACLIRQSFAEAK